jgi:hypothetical protein
MAQHLAPLVQLTRLSFEGRPGCSEALSEAKLALVVDAAAPLAGLARLAARVPGGGWPEAPAARAREVLPGCRLGEV